MQTLYILAGPNGAGKTTYYYTALQHRFITRRLPFINLDVIARELGGYSAENFAKAEMIYREKLIALYFIDNSSDEAIEIGFVKDDKLTELLINSPNWFDKVISVEKRLRRNE